MKKTIATALLAIPMLAAGQYTGKVYVDANHNGKFDKGETLMKNVAVSDGLNVVVTDSKGAFSLPGHKKARFVFITTPSGYRTENAYYQRIDTTGAKPSYDFGVLPYNAIAKDGSHKFIHVSDTEIGEVQGQDRWTDNLREYAANNNVAFIMHSGDICYPGGLKSHIQVMNSANMPETQVFYSVGNHDLVDGKYGEEMFENIYGPVCYSFDAGNVHYVVTPIPGGDRWPDYKMDEVFSWVANDLKHMDPNKSLYFINHTIPSDCGCPDFVYTLKNGEKVDLTAHNLKAWLYGHWHVNHVYTHPATGAKIICSSTPIRGGIDHALSAFRVMHIDSKGDFTSDFRYSYIDGSMVIASIQNHQAPVNANGTVPLVVNAYASVSPVAKMSYSCTFDGAKVAAGVAMARKSDFAWVADMKLPAKAAGHYVTVEVTASFENGEVAKKSASFLYDPESANKINADTDWTNMLENPQHIGIVADTLSAPALAWTANIGSNIYMASPVISDGNIYVASIDDNQTGKAAVMKMNAADGSVAWKTPMKSSVRNSIAVDGGMVFAQDVQGVVYGLSTADGSIVWQKDLKIGVTPALNDGLIAADGIVYAGTGKQLTAFKGKTGEIIWQNTGWNRGEGCVSTLSLGTNGVLVGSSHWGALHGNDAKTGKHLWSDGSNDLRFRAASPAMVGEVLYVTAGNNLVMMESRTGKILMSKALPFRAEVASTPLVTADAIIYGTSGDGLVAVDKQTFEVKWQFKTRESMIQSSPYQADNSATVEASPVLCGDKVYVGASDGTFYAIDAKTGRLQWQHHVGAPIFAAAAVSGNGIFVVDFGGNVYGFACKSTSK